MKLTGMYTDAGAALAAQALAENKTLTVTRAAAGSGLTAVSRSSMVRENQPLTLYPMERQNAKVILPASLTSAAAAQDYPLREIGVYARLNGGTEVLYKLFRLDEQLTVERAAELTVNFYLTETLLPSDRLEVTISLQGMMTQEACSAAVQKAETSIRSDLNQHISMAVKAINGKASASHTHAAGDITGGTLGGEVAARSSTNNLKPQLRNIAIGTTNPQGGENGQLWIRYTP